MSKTGTIQYDSTQENHISISLITLDRLFKAKMIGLVDLYVFYLKTAKWQKTNQTKCTDNYVRAVLDLGEKRLYSLKGQLKELGLIEIIKTQGEKGKFTGHFIKVNYIHAPSTTPASHGVGDPVCGEDEQMLYTGKEVLYTGKEVKNINKKNLEESQQAISCFSFDEFWKAYNYSVGKQKCIKLYSKIVETDRALIKKHVFRYVESTMKPNKPETGKISRKHPSTYLNQECWNDELDVEDPTGFRDNPTYKVYKRGSALAISGPSEEDLPLLDRPLMHSLPKNFYWNSQQIYFDTNDECYTIDGKTPVDVNDDEIEWHHCFADVESSIEDFKKDLALWRDGKGDLI